VYAGLARLGERTLPAAISVGVAPTFADARDLVEAHLFGYEGPLLYGAELAIDFYERLRPQRRFASSRALAEAMRVDIATAERIVATWVTPES
ncbi:MAG TPA: riboflavin kinase, partial [Coriobacteriia bacterium]|nr:riboflavin kinase [Coriobacteriia bacterium]